MNKTFSLLFSLGIAFMALPAGAKDIIHDAEYYLLEAQNGERWQKEDRLIGERLADIRRANGGKPPNIVYILLDDLGFGEIGMPDMDVTRGYSTPNISAFAKEGLSLQRMYTEPSCTPTRVAMMTGRHPVRTGMTEAKATLAGEGLSGDEITIAEILTSPLSSAKRSTSSPHSSMTCSEDWTLDWISIEPRPEHNQSTFTSG